MCILFIFCHMSCTSGLHNTICCLYLLCLCWKRSIQKLRDGVSLFCKPNIHIFVINILFFFLGMCLNSLVIVSFWRSVQLRKKLCYFTIMVLSCCDLLVVLTNHPYTAFVTILWLTEKIYKYPAWLLFPYCLFNIFTGFSLLALLVMNVDRYLHGDTLSHFSSNICDKGETFNSLPSQLLLK